MASAAPNDTAPDDTAPDDTAPAESAEHRAARAALFSTELLRRVDAMARAIEAGRFALVAAEANALATGAVAFRLGALAADATRAERAARSGDAPGLAQAFRTLQCGVHAALAVLRAPA